MCQQTFLSKTVKIVSIISLSAVALGSVLRNSSSAAELEHSESDEDNRELDTSKIIPNDRHG